MGHGNYGKKRNMEKERKPSEAIHVCRGLMYATWNGYIEHYFDDDEFDEKFFEDGQDSDKHIFKV